MILTDTHTHLYSRDSPFPIDELIQRAENSHVFRFFLPNIDQDTCTEVLALQNLYPGKCFAMLGLHPVHVKEDYSNQLASIKEHIEFNTISAIGEIGMDLYWDQTYIEEQKKAFILQCEWASSLNLPISIHCRNAFPEIMEILENLKSLNIRGIFHCFTGTEEEALKIIDLGFYLGIGGVLTYKNSNLKDSLRNIDLRHIVLETDSPYLPPVPFRGKPNESAYLIYIAEFLAKVKNVSLKELADITTENSKTIFGS
jgi:TatD DNase family protein